MYELQYVPLALPFFLFFHRLIGADLLNLGKLQGLGAPVVSIEQLGTFDAVFLTGIVAVLLASFSGHPAFKGKKPCNPP